MRPVQQTTFAGKGAPVAEQGNCFAACVASLLEIPLAEAETYIDGLTTPNQLEAQWWERFVSWCGERNLVPLYLPWGEEATPDQYAYGKPGMRYIACGKTPRGEPHAVVYRDGELDHDPHPSGIGIEKVDSYVVLAAKL